MTGVRSQSSEAQLTCPAPHQNEVADAPWLSSAGQCGESAHDHGDQRGGLASTEMGEVQLLLTMFGISLSDGALSAAFLKLSVHFGAFALLISNTLGFIGIALT